MKLSIVIPLLNEAPNLPSLCEEVVQAVSKLELDYEIIFIDDGSTDDSLAVLKQLQLQHNHLIIVQFRRNFGQTAGLAAGLDLASGDVVITMDADRQNDPADIPILLNKIDEGYDMVCGWRHKRKDTFISRKLPSIIANKIISSTTDVRLNDYGCTLKAMRRDVAKNITLYGELHRFIPAIASWMGVKIAEVKVNHRARTMGVSKYGISRMFRVVLDLITVKFLISYSGRPIHFFGLPGLAFSSIGFFIACVMTFQRFFMGIAMGERPLLLLAIFLMMTGLQLIVFGLLAELQIRTYHESQNKPIYVIKQIYE